MGLHVMTFEPETAELADLQAAAADKCKREGRSTAWIAGAMRDTLVLYLADKPAGKPVETGRKPARDTQAPAETAGGDSLAALIAAAVGPLVKAPAPGLDVAAVKALIQAELASLTVPRPVAITVNNAPAVTFDRAHKVLPKVVQALAAGLHVWLTGPAGSGKTTIGEQAAEALKSDFRVLSVCAQTPLSALMGYMDASGRYVSTAFRECFEQGKVFILDEVDAGNPNVLAALNGALANGICSFADGNVKRHPNFRVVACANTWGNGPTGQFVGRLAIDAATLDRFVRLHVDYDTDLESAISPDAAWLAIVRKYRAAADRLKLNVIVSPRAVTKGAALLAQGWTVAETLEATILAGVSDDARAKLAQGVSNG